MNKVITISRQYASGGRTIGKMVAQELGIPLYDSEIIKDTMKKTGLSSDMIEAAEQRVTNSFLFNLAMGVDDAHNQMKQIEKAEGYKKKTYDNLMDEIISKEEYVKYIEEYNQKISDLLGKKFILKSVCKNSSLLV